LLSPIGLTKRRNSALQSSAGFQEWFTWQHFSLYHFYCQYFSGFVLFSAFCLFQKVLRIRRAQKPILSDCSHVTKQPLPKVLCKNLKNSLFCVCPQNWGVFQKEALMFIFTCCYYWVSLSTCKSVEQDIQCEKSKRTYFRAVLLHRVLSIYLKQR